MKIYKILLFFSICASLVIANENNSAIVRMNALETNLLESDSVKIDFNITATGAIEANAKGTLQLLSGNRIQFSANGGFAGDTLKLVLFSDGSELQISNGKSNNSAQTPPYLNQGLIIGLTRMGLLHNIAVMQFGRQPDKTDGTVQQWVTVKNVQNAEKNDNAITFDVFVDNVLSAETELIIDAKTGLPLLRFQTVHFESGDMKVKEEYTIHK